MEQVTPDSTATPSRRNLFAGVLCIPLIAWGVSDEGLPDSALTRLNLTIGKMAATADALGSEYSQLERAYFQCATTTESMTVQVARAEAAHDRAERALAEVLDLFGGINATTIAGLILKAKWASRSCSVADSIVTDLIAMEAPVSARAADISSGIKLQAS